MSVVAMSVVMVMFVIVTMSIVLYLRGSCWLW